VRRNRSTDATPLAIMNSGDDANALPSVATPRARTATPRKRYSPGKGLDAASSGVNFFKDAQVGSARGYISVAGNILAIPHKIPGRRRAQTPQANGPRFNGVTEYMQQYREQHYCYCSMDKKPLQQYNPGAYRSRIAIEDAPVPYKNASIVDFNDGIHTCHKKRFHTNNRTFYTGEPCDPRSNQGILAENTHFRRSLMSR